MGSLFKLQAIKFVAYDECENSEVLSDALGTEEAVVDGGGGRLAQVVDQGINSARLNIAFRLGQFRFVSQHTCALPVMYVVRTYIA